MAIKNQAKIKKATTSEIGKRFSKAKIKHEMVSENTNIKKVLKTPKVTTEPKKYVCTAEDVYQFRGVPKRVYSAIIKQPSFQQKGYEVLSKGQQVTVEYFGDDQPLRITAIDGRVGITCANNIKSLFS